MIFVTNAVNVPAKASALLACSTVTSFLLFFCNLYGGGLS